VALLRPPSRKGRAGRTREISRHRCPPV
jgi:hypothetical protein